MGFARRFFSLALIAAFLGVPVISAQAEDDSVVAERAPASKKNHKKKNKAKGIEKFIEETPDKI